MAQARAPRDPRWVSVAVEDAILAYAITHPTHGPCPIAEGLRLERFGSIRVAYGTGSNVLGRPAGPPQPPRSHGSADTPARALVTEASRHARETVTTPLQGVRPGPDPVAPEVPPAMRSSA